MHSRKHEALADTIGTETDLDAQRTFWLAHMRMGFGIVLLGAVIVFVYLRLTPHGPHRATLLTVVVAWTVGSLVAMATAPFFATRSWRAAYSATWTIASTFAAGLVALLDTGIKSPILLLLFLPLVYGTMMFTPRVAVACGGAALAAVLFVVAVDRHYVASIGWTVTLIGSVVSAAALSVAAAVNRSHIEAHEQRLLAELAEMAGTDELTGCAVRRILRQRTEEEIERAMRSGSNLSLLMIDVDQFKSVNDNYGHIVGDRVLTGIGNILLANVRPFDVAGRMGGDEFALLLPETDASAAVQVAERIFKELAGTGEVPVTLSIGVASLDRSMPTAEHLIDEADMALYQVKRAGRDAIAVRNPSGAAAQRTSF